MPGGNDKDKKKKGPATPRETESPRTSITAFLNKKTSDAQITKKGSSSSLRSENGSHESPRFKRATSSLFFRKKRLTNVSDLQLPSSSIYTENNNKLETPPSEDKKTVLVADTEYRFPVGAPTAVSYLEEHLLQEDVIYRERVSFQFTDYSQPSPRGADEDVAEGSGLVQEAEGSGLVQEAEGSGLVQEAEGSGSAQEAEGSGSAQEAEGSSFVNNEKNLSSCFKDFTKKDESARASSSSEGLSKGKSVKIEVFLKRNPKVTSYRNLLPCFSAPLQQEIDTIKLARETLLEGIVNGILIPTLKKNKAYDAKAVQDTHHLIQGIDYQVELNPQEENFLNENHKRFFKKQKNKLPKEFISNQRKELILGADNLFKGLKTIFQERNIKFDNIFESQQFISLMTLLIKENCRYIQKRYELDNVTSEKMIRIGNEVYYHQNYAAYRQNKAEGTIAFIYGKLVDPSIEDEYGYAFKDMLLTLLEKNKDNPNFNEHFDQLSKIDVLYVHASFLNLMIRRSNVEAFQLTLNQTSNPLPLKSEGISHKGKSLRRTNSEGF